MGGITNLAGNKYKIVKGEKVKPGRSKSVNENPCEVTKGGTSKVGCMFSATEAWSFREIVHLPIKKVLQNQTTTEHKCLRNESLLELLETQLWSPAQT